MSVRKSRARAGQIGVGQPLIERRVVEIGWRGGGWRGDGAGMAVLGEGVGQTVDMERAVGVETGVGQKEDIHGKGA
jgi:hypothetical protein